MLLFHYFIISLFYYFIIALFYYFIILLFYYFIILFIILLFYYLLSYFRLVDLVVSIVCGFKFELRVGEKSRNKGVWMIPEDMFASIHKATIGDDVEKVLSPLPLPTRPPLSLPPSPPLPPHSPPLFIPCQPFSVSHPYIPLF
jgi:hypothetical protein